MDIFYPIWVRLECRESQTTSIRLTVSISFSNLVGKIHSLERQKIWNMGWMLQIYQVTENTAVKTHFNSKMLRFSKFFKFYRIIYLFSILNIIYHLIFFPVVFCCYNLRKCKILNLLFSTRVFVTCCNICNNDRDLARLS